VGYNESLKAYRIYIPSQRQIEVSRDVIFEKEIAFHRSIESQMEIGSETIPSSSSTVHRDISIDTVDPIAPVDIPRDIAVGHKRHVWASKTLQEEKGHETPQGTFRKSKRPKLFQAIL
jgi:hypothetical protein